MCQCDTFKVADKTFKRISENTIQGPDKRIFNRFCNDKTDFENSCKDLFTYYYSN